MVLEEMLHLLAFKLAVNIIVFFFSAIVAFLIFFFSYKTYRLTKERKYLYFSLGFILLSASLIFHAIGNLSIFLGIQRCFLEISCNLSQQFLFFSHFIHVVLTFLAYTGLILIYSRAKDRSLVYFAFVQTLLLAFFTYNSYLFNFVGFIFMLFLSSTSFKNYNSNKNLSTLLAFVAFSFIGLSHALFLFSYMASGYIFLFLGYFAFLLIFKGQILKTKKKNDTKKK